MSDGQLSKKGVFSFRIFQVFHANKLLILGMSGGYLLKVWVLSARAFLLKMPLYNEFWVG